MRERENEGYLEIQKKVQRESKIPRKRERYRYREYTRL